MRRNPPAQGKGGTPPARGQCCIAMLRNPALVPQGTARWEPISCPPVGGTYIQVKNSVHPGTLWSGTVWVSSDVPSGAFVRQEGGKAAAFGHSGVQGQQIMQHDHKSNEYSSSGDSIRSVRAGTCERTHQRRKTAYTTGVLFGGGWDDEGLGTSVGSENRPPNATVKFWPRANSPPSVDELSAIGWPISIFCPLVTIGT